MKHRRLFLSAAALSALALAQNAGAAVISYSNDFSSTGFSQSVGLTTAGGVTTAGVTSTSASNEVDYGSEQFTNAGNNSYVITTQFRVTSIGGTSGSTNDKTVGLVLFAHNATFTQSASTPFVLMDFVYVGGNSGALRLREFTTSGASIASNSVDINGASTANAITVDTTYTLRLSVTNTGTNTYSLTGGIFDEAGTTQIGSSILGTYNATVSQPAGGYYMGVRSNFNNTSGTGSLWYDNYAVTLVPEPSACILLGLGAIGFLHRRRR